MNTDYTIVQSQPNNTPQPYDFGNSQKMGVESYLTTQEIIIMGEMRVRAQTEGLCVPDEMLVMALMARKFEIPRSLILLKNLITWRREHAADLILDDVIIKEMKTGKVVAPPGARDRTGAQLIYFVPRNHNPKDSSPHDVFRMVYYLICKLLSDIQTQRSGFFILVDLLGAGWHNCDLKLPRLFVKNMQNRFPGRLHLVLIVHPPKVFKTMFSLVKPFIPDKYLGKINVLEATELLQYVEPHNLLPEYGGTMYFNQLEFVHLVIAQHQQDQVNFISGVPNQ